MEKIATSPQPLIPRPPQKWYEHFNLDLIIKVLNQTFLHPFVAWIIVLCLRAQVTPTDHPAWIGAVGYAIFLTLLTVAGMLNRRLAYGLPRDVEPSHEVIVITGGGSGLGQLIAQIYGMRGASVAVLDIKEVSEVEGWDELSGVEYYQCDVGNRKALEMTAKKIEDDLGKPTVLINCAAAAVHGLPLLSLTPESMKKTIQTNLMAPFHLIQIFLPAMLETNLGGVIVNVSSVLGHLTAAGLSDYSVSKAGLSALHRSLEVELRASGHDDKIKTLLVETGQLSTPLFNGIETPSRFFAPVLEPIQVAYDIVSAIDNGQSGVIRLPAFAKLVNWYAVLPASIQRLARYLSGIDTAVAKAYNRNVFRPESVPEDGSESDV
ncbi:short-chain dehydrogenase/reductase family protein, putative [Talaromyces stipitatus ATCC 10500]|uniref:Short-chain dehydrogenase/reductase family protein, putative n=1 Tax=Talaromyces stipitatus (strain ATCC 10500 / CBS 375.48 / QM 6759 / NRRL 1006) TaxID=441959 RepID=B8M6N6_TALSN|nr:short-chain dehydrogenase/reductase family protein, putative [Talaromyces stipitatus ATCC 10500]EED19498.1 short-chain dehydrogenase/reductase family protein, putative [Talaromyces stipitatus ATCC 10500]